jgi:uncharacterized protein
MRYSILLAVLLFSTFAGAAEPEFEQHQVILLVRGAKWTPEKTAETEKIQAAHLEHLTKMAQEGKLVVAGPFDKQSDETLRGMCIYKVETIEEAIKLASDDPAVKAGRLKIVSMNWWTEKGYLAFPKAPNVIKTK